MSEYIVAIDLGSSKIAGIVAQKDTNGLLKILAVESEPSVGIKRGLVYNHSEAAACVGRVVKKLQNRVSIQIGKVYIGLGGHTLKTVINSVPRTFEKETELTEEIIKALSKANDEVSVEDASVYEVLEQEFILDGEPEANPLGCNCSHVEARYLLVLGKEGINERLCSCLERIPQKLAGMFTAPIVLSETLVSPREKELGCVLIDFGAETTTVVVYADNFIRHMAVIPFGGKTITQDIRDLKVTLVDAENLKKTFGYALAALDKQPKAIKLESPLQGQDDILVKTKVMNAIIEARLDEILDMVFMQVEKSGFMDRLSAGIIITGGASQLRGLSELIEMKTGLKTRQGNFEQLLVNPEDAKQLNQAHSLLLGLVNFGTEDCQLIEKTIEIQPVETPPMPQKDKSKKKGNRLKDFVNKLEGSLFNERDFEDN